MSEPTPYESQPLGSRSDPFPSVAPVILDDVSRFLDAASGKRSPSPDTLNLRRLAIAAADLPATPLLTQIREAMLQAADNLDRLRELRTAKDAPQPPEPPPPPPPPPPRNRLAAAIENLSQAFRDIGLDPPVALLLRTQAQVWHLEACMQQDGFMAEDKAPGSASQIMGMQIQCLEKARRP